MRAERREMSENEILPTWDANGEWVSWKDRVFPFVNFYLCHEVSARLLNILEFFPHKSREFREKMSSYVREESEFLVQLLPGISAEAMMKAFYASIAVKHYLLEENENDRIRAAQYLLAIRKLLHFDELFVKWQSPRERSLSQEQVQMPAQEEILR